MIKFFTGVFFGMMLVYGVNMIADMHSTKKEIPFEETAGYKWFKKQREEERARCLQNPYCAMKDTLAEFDYEQTQKGKL